MVKVLALKAIGQLESPRTANGSSNSGKFINGQSDKLWIIIKKTSSNILH